MANAKLVVVAIMAMFVLLHVSCAVAARHHGKPDPCAGGGDGAEDSSTQQVPGKMSHKKGHPHPGCSSPAVSARGGTRAVMTVNGFERGQDGGDPSECDGRYHSNKEMLVALSTRWYAGGRRCHKKIRITSVQTGRTVEGTVVDECDSRHGCKNNIVDTSAAVWEALGLDTDVGEVPVIWSDV
ncbi:hypothetical protein ACP4OV_024847 [Aristida adscensionis]